MKRSPKRFAAVAASLIAAVMTMGCVGTIEPGPAPAADAGNQPPRDPSGTPPPPPPPEPVADAGVDATPDPFLVCRDPVTEGLPSGNHNAGRNCMQCHSDDGPGPRWYAAGTVYVDGAGTEPLAGVTITIKDATGKTVNLVTARNGNFWTPERLEYPLYTFASSCPDIQSMGPEVPATANGSCNSCHGSSVPRINL